MKKQSNAAYAAYATISLGNMETLTGIVKETLAYGIRLPKSKTFTAADLWNIQRQGKRSIQRRFIF